jgi:hypothetical protein
MNPKPENEKTPSDQMPGNQTPTEEPGKPARELGEDDLKQVAGGGWDVHTNVKI